MRVQHVIVTPRTVVDDLRKLSDVPIRLVEYGEKEFERSKDVPELEEIYLKCVCSYIILALLSETHCIIKHTV